MNRTEIRAFMERLEQEKRLPLAQVHILVPTSPSLLNRDGNGRVKTVVYGGTSRVYYSAASARHPIRLKRYKNGETHSKFLPQLVAGQIRKEHAEVTDKYLDAVIEILEGGNGKKGSKQILAFGETDIKAIADIVYESAPDEVAIKDKKVKESLEKALKLNAKERKIDDTTCLMGRMSTDENLLVTIESAIRMNAPYSIDEWHGDTDTFIASDDSKDQLVGAPDYIKFLDSSVSDKGAAHFDVTDIASNIFYGYTCLSTRTLLENLLRDVDKEDRDGIKTAIETAREITKNYIMDYITTRPSAKQTSYATASAPLAVYITVGTRVQNITCDSYFEKVIKADGSKSVGEKGVEQLRRFAENEANGSFSINEYQKAFWISDLYNDVPVGCTATSLKAAADEIANMIGD